MVVAHRPLHCSLTLSMEMEFDKRACSIRITGLVETRFEAGLATFERDLPTRDYLDRVKLLTTPSHRLFDKEDLRSIGNGEAIQGKEED